MRYRFLDSLRGFAICGVILTHVGLDLTDLPPTLKSFSIFGFRGVQLFFILSALTLCMVNKPDRFQYIPFLIRRFFRIAPMYYIALLFYVLMEFASVWNIPPNGLYASDIVANLLFIHGFIPHAINNVVPGGWSIASEAIFYLTFPIFFKYITSVTRAIMLLVCAFLLAMTNLYLAHVISDYFGDSVILATFFHFNFLTNLPAFASGLFLYNILKVDLDRGGLRRPTLVSFFIMFVFSLYSCFNNIVPGAGSQLAAIPMLTLIVYVAALGKSILVVNRPASYLGEISFSMYLNHWVVLKIVERAVPENFTAIAKFSFVYFAALAISSLWATITYRWVELPMIALGRAIAERTMRSQRNERSSVG